MASKLKRHPENDPAPKLPRRGKVDALLIIGVPIDQHSRPANVWPRGAVCLSEG